MDNQPAKKTAISETLTSALMGNKSNAPSLISLVRAAAISEIGKPAEGANEEELKVYQANVNHAVSVALGRLQSRTSVAFRQMAWNMYKSGDWMDVRLPIVDPVSKQPIRDVDGLIEFENFTSYEDWYWRVVEDAGLDPTIASVTASCVIRLLPAVSKGITNKDGEIVQIDDVMSLERSKLEVITGPINKLLDDYQSTSNPLKLKEIGSIIEDARTKTKEELKKSLSKSGHRGTRVNQMKCYVSELPDATSSYTIIVNASQQKFLEGILSGRLDIYPVELRELAGLASRSFGVSSSEPEDEDDDENTEYDLVNGKIIHPVK